MFYILIQVISPEIEKNVREELEQINFVTLITDTSNRKADKMLPILVRCFHEEKGVKVFKLDVKLIPNEKSETIGTELVGTGITWNVVDKVVAFGADNCPTNFGGVTRNGKNNVFFRLKEILRREIVGIGCACHITHNAFDASCEQLPIQIEALVVVIYKHFHIHTLRVEALKELCEGGEITYHSSVRFLTLHPAVKKVTKIANVNFQLIFHYNFIFRSSRCLSHSRTSLKQRAVAQLVFDVFLMTTMRCFGSILLIRNSS